MVGSLTLQLLDDVANPPRYLLEDSSETRTVRFSALGSGVSFFFGRTPWDTRSLSHVTAGEDVAVQVGCYAEPVTPCGATVNVRVVAAGTTATGTDYTTDPALSSGVVPVPIAFASTGIRVGTFTVSTNASGANKSLLLEVSGARYLVYITPSSGVATPLVSFDLKTGAGVDSIGLANPVESLQALYEECDGRATGCPNAVRSRPIVLLATAAAASEYDVPMRVGGTATVNEDYSVSGNNVALNTQGRLVVTFNAGSRREAFTITVTKDDDFEGTESIELEILSGTGYTTHDRTKRYTNKITENDLISASITGPTNVDLNTQTVREGDAALEFCFNVPETSWPVVTGVISIVRHRQPVRVNGVTADNSLQYPDTVLGADVNISPRKLSLRTGDTVTGCPGTRSGRFTVNLVDDEVVELTEYMVLDLSTSPVSASSRITVPVLDDDVVRIGFERGSAVVVEGETEVAEALIQIQPPFPFDGSSPDSYAQYYHEVYLGVSGTATERPLEDTGEDEPRRFRLRRLILAPMADAPGDFSLQPNIHSLAGGNSAGPWAVNISTLPVPRRIDGTMYQVYQMLLPQAAAMAGLMVQIVADTEREFPETVELKLLNVDEVSNRGEFPAGDAKAPRIETIYTVDANASTHRMTIASADIFDIGFTQSRSIVTERNGMVSIAVAIADGVNAPVDFDVSYTVDAVSSTAQSPGDFGALSGSLTVSAGDNSGMITLSTVDNNASVDTNKVVDIVLDTVLSYNLLAGAERHRVVILDDENAKPAKVRFSGDAFTLMEDGEALTIEVSLDSPLFASSDLLIVRDEVRKTSSLRLAVPVTIAGTATLGVDYRLTGSGTLLNNNYNLEFVSSCTDTAGATMACTPPLVALAPLQITITPVNDVVLGEGIETIELDVGTLNGADRGSPASTRLEIVDDDALRIVFATSESSVTEAAGTTARVRINVDNPPAADLPVTVVVDDSSTAAERDYTLRQPLVIAAGNRNVDLQIDVMNDALDTDSRRLVLRLVSGTGYTTGSPDTHALVITDDDLRTLSFGRAPVVRRDYFSGQLRLFSDVEILSSSYPPDDMQIRIMVTSDISASLYSVAGVSSGSFVLSSERSESSRSVTNLRVSTPFDGGLGSVTLQLPPDDAEPPEYQLGNTDMQSRTINFSADSGVDAPLIRAYTTAGITGIAYITGPTNVDLISQDTRTHPDHPAISEGDGDLEFCVNAPATMLESVGMDLRLETYAPPFLFRGVPQTQGGFRYPGVELDSDVRISPERVVLRAGDTVTGCPGNRSGSFTVRVLDDEIVEITEYMQLDMVAALPPPPPGGVVPGGGIITEGNQYRPSLRDPGQRFSQITLRVLDNDAVRIGFARDSAVAVEGGTEEAVELPIQVQPPFPTDSLPDSYAQYYHEVYLGISGTATEQPLEDTREDEPLRFRLKRLILAPSADTPGDFYLQPNIHPLAGGNSAGPWAVNISTLPLSRMIGGKEYQVYQMLLPQAAAMVGLMVQVVVDDATEGLENAEFRLLNAEEVMNRGEFPAEDQGKYRPIRTIYTVDASRSTFRLGISDP